MSRRRPILSGKEPLILDLPLEAPGAPTTTPSRDEEPAVSSAPAAETTLAMPELAEGWLPLEEPDEGKTELLSLTVERPTAPLLPRVWSAGADALIHAGILAGASLGLSAMDMAPRVSDWQAFAVFLLAFSYLYTVISLAFWGQTAGMAWRGLYCRDRREDRPLSFRQATLKWAGGLVTLVLAGLPLLLALAGNSFSDWLSRSQTLLAASEEG